jgi:hypothetical protein
MEELEVLVEDVTVNKQLLLGKFSDTTTDERKKKVWKNISAKMSAVGDTKRCSDDVRKNWQDWSSQIKGKKYRLVRNYRATGGGHEEAPKLTAIEEKILAIIGPTAVSGLLSTSDTDFDTFNIHPRSVELTCNETIDSDCDDDLSQTLPPFVFVDLFCALKLFVLHSHHQSYMFFYCCLYCQAQIGPHHLNYYP